jgi:molybdenum cofactor cytidylyltransferase
MTSPTHSVESSESIHPPADRKVGALVLAAGFSRRYGAGDSKLCALLSNGITVLQQTLLQIRGATCHIVVVTRQELLEEGLLDTGLCHVALPASRNAQDPAPRILISTKSHLGMAHTLSEGIGQISAWDACLVCLGDMPFIRTSTYQQLLAALRHDAIVVPEYQGRSGHPVGFGRTFFEELQQLRGDGGGRAVLDRYPEQIVRLPVSDESILQDVDTPADLRRWQ